MLKLNVPVPIKLILTEQTKQQITSELNGAIQQIQNELDQIEFQGRKALQDAEKAGNQQAIQGITASVQRERQVRIERREQIMQNLVNIQQTQLGSEINGGQVNTEVQIRVGDIWEDVMNGTEIVLRDGVVAEIRRAGDHA